MTDASGTGPPQAGASRRLKIALVLSLAFNLLIVGTIGGSIWAFRHNPPWAMAAVHAHLLGFTRTLPKQRRYEIWRSTRTERAALRPFRKQVRQARDEARNMLQAEPFDKEKFAAAQAHVLETEISFRREAQRLFVGVAALLTPAERAAFAKWQPKQRELRRRARRRNHPGGAAARNESGSAEQR